jgi:hypothetical protein
MGLFTGSKVDARPALTRAQVRDKLTAYAKMSADVNVYGDVDDLDNNLEVALRRIVEIHKKVR